MVIKQKNRHRVVTNKVLKAGTFPEIEKLSELLIIFTNSVNSVVNLLF